MGKENSPKKRIKYNRSKRLWELITIDCYGNPMPQVDFVKTKKQATEWLNGSMGNGNCYEIAAQTALKWDKPQDPLVCHGMVVGQGPIEGCIYGHAWIEYEIEAVKRSKLSIVVDKSNGKNIVVPAQIYYNLGKITKVKKYSKSEVRNNLVKLGTWGPWDSN